MAAPKRRPIQIERDRREIAERYLEGKTQAAIAEYLNGRAGIGYKLTRQMIGYDLKALQSQWRESALINIDEAKAKELAKIDRLEWEYWIAWERSCADAETITEKGKGTGTAVQDFEKTIQRRGQAGDPRFLQGVQWCIDRRCKILGVDAPQKVEHAGKDGEPLPAMNVTVYLPDNGRE